MKNNLLVNKTNKMKDSYLKNCSFIQTKDMDGKDISVEKETFEQYLKLKEFLKEKNISIEIASAYRNVEDQQRVWNEYFEKEGEEYCKKYVAPPG